MSSSTETPKAHLKANYTSPTNAPLSVSTQLDFPTDPASVEGKTAYLGALRQATTALQETINNELTARMEEDKARESQVGVEVEKEAAGKRKRGVDEAAEEENYGEEVQEDDD